MHKQAVEELDKLMADKIFLALDTPPVDLLKSYLASKNYIGNIVCKILDESSQFYVLLHFTKDSPFTGQEEYNYFCLTFSIVLICLQSTIKIFLLFTACSERELALSQQTHSFKGKKLLFHTPKVFYIGRSLSVRK